MKHRISFYKHTIFVILLTLVLAFAPAAAFAQTTGTNTTGAEETGSDEELERRREVYTIVALVTAGAIIVGIRNKRGRW